MPFHANTESAGMERGWNGPNSPQCHGVFSPFQPYPLVERTLGEGMERKRVPVGDLLFFFSVGGFRHRMERLNGEDFPWNSGQLRQRGSEAGVGTAGVGVANGG